MPGNVVEEIWSEAIEVSKTNNELVVKAGISQDPASWNGAYGTPRQERGLTFLKSEIERLREPYYSMKYNRGGIGQYRQNVIDFARSCCEPFSISEPVSFEEDLFSGVGIVVLRVTFTDPDLGSELASGLTKFIDVLKKFVFTYLQSDLPLERGTCTRLKACFFSVINALSVALCHITLRRIQAIIEAPSRKVSKALIPVNTHSKDLDQELAVLFSHSLADARAKETRLAPVPPQAQSPPQPELLARLDRIEAALKLSRLQPDSTQMSEAAVQDALAETRAWVSRSADVMSIRTSISREFYVGSVAPPYAIDPPQLGGDRYYTDGSAGAAEPGPDPSHRMEG